MQFLKSLVFNILLFAGLVLIFILAIPTLVLPSKFTLFFGRLSAKYIIVLLNLVLRTKVVFKGLDNLKKVSYSQKEQEWPAEAGKRMNIKNPIFSVK